MKKQSRRFDRPAPRKMVVKQSRKTRRASNDQEYQSFDIEAEIAARAEGPKRKSWSSHDLIPLRPMNDKQAEAIEQWVMGQNVALLGSTGTGKTALAVYLAASSMLRKDEAIDKIIIVRSVVQARDIGFLPGDLAEKLAPYEEPYTKAFADRFGRSSTYEDMKAAGKIVFCCTSMLRGVTFDNAVIIFDEVQNCEFKEIDTVLSRLGQHSRILFLGDRRQTDLNSRQPSGLPVFREIVRDIKMFSVIEFTRDDIVRSGFVRSWITASEIYFESLERPSGPTRPQLVRSNAA